MINPAIIGSVCAAAKLKSQQSSWTPTSISGLLAWYDTSTLSGLTDNTPIGSNVWSDNSGNGKDASNPATNIYWEHNPTYDLNNKGALFIYDSLSFLTNSLNLGNPPYTVFSVIKQPTAPSIVYFVNGGIGVSGFRTYAQSDGKIYIDKSGIINIVASTGTLSADAAHIVITTLDNLGTGSIYIDSATADSTGTSLQTYDSCIMQFGQGGGSGTYLYNLGIYSKVLSSGEITSLYNYLKSFYAL